MNGLFLGIALLLFATLANTKEKTFEVYDNKVLRVCSSRNLPFSTTNLSGFENKIATFIAKKLKILRVEYIWHPLGVGFIRNTLNTNLCDLVLSTTLKNGLLLNTNPYYQSAYVFVYRQHENLKIKHLSDKNLQYLRIGLSNNTPPLSVLLESGFDYQLHYYPLLVDNRYYSVQQKMIDDLLAKKIDVAIAWGPSIGNNVQKYANKLQMTKLKDKKMYFKISMGVRNGEIELKHRINRILRKHRTAINAILKSYNVPLVL